MKYEATGQKTNKDTAKNAEAHSLRGVSTKAMFWAIIKRHKFGLVTIWAVIMTILYMLPFLPGEIFSLVS